MYLKISISDDLGAVMSDIAPLPYVVRFESCLDSGSCTEVDVVDGPC